MTYSTPDLDTISLTCDAAIRGATRRDPTMPRSMLGVLSKMLSGAVDGLYDAIDAAAKDIILTTASKEAIIRQAGVWGYTLKAPTAARAIVSISGGTGTLRQGALFSRFDGIEYALTADVTLSGGPGLGSVVCTSAGAMTTLTDGTVLTIVQPAEGISPNATVTATSLTPGTDIEMPEELLARLLVRIRQTPQGGAEADYEEWATSVSGVTRAWTIPHWNGQGTVGVLFMCDDRTNPIPQAGDVANVQAAIDALGPVGAAKYAGAPTGVPLNFSIHLNPTSSALQTAVQSALAELIATECTPKNYTLLISHIRAAISSVIGTGDYTMPSPSGDVTTPTGSITTMGTITWL